MATFVHEPYLERGSGHRALISAWQRRQLRILLSFSRCAAASIESWARLVSELEPSIPVAHLPVASNLPDRRDRREERRSKLGAGSRLVVSLFSTGHDSRNDGHALAALQALVKDQPDVLCLNLGAGARPVAHVPESVEVVTPGWLDADVLAEHLAATDIFLSPLVDGASTRRTTIAAALQHEVAVVSTDGHLTDSELRDADAGLALAPVEDPVAFGALVGQLARSREDRLELGRRGRAAYERRWSWSAGVPRLIALLDDGDRQPSRVPRNTRSQPAPSVYEHGEALRIAWTGPVGHEGGPWFATTLLRSLLDGGAQVDLFLPGSPQDLPAPLNGVERLSVVSRQSGWQWGRWYSANMSLAFVTSAAARVVTYARLSLQLALRHQAYPYDLVFQLSQPETFVPRWLADRYPPVVLYPGTHAAGELRWLRAERALAKRYEPRGRRILARTYLTARARLQRREYAKAALVLAASERFRALLCADCGIPVARTRVLPHPIDLDRFTPGPLVRPASPVTLLFVSRLSARKGLELIVGLSRRLGDLEGQVRIAVYGGATMWSDYSAMLGELDPRIASYGGALPALDLVEAYRSAHALLLPSRYEPFGLVVGEALACGLPTVVSDQVGAGESVSELVCRRFPDGDLDAFEREVRKLLGDLERDESGIRSAAAAQARGLFAPGAIGAQLRDILREAVTDEPSPAPGRRSVAQRAAHRLLRRLPPAWVRGAGRLQFKYPWLRPVVACLAARVADAETVIAHGVGAGLRFRGTGGYPGYVLGTSEPEEQALLQAELGPGAVFYDIGANVGFFSTLAGRLVGPTGRVFAFEPFPLSADRAEANAALNHLGQVTVIRAAVGRGPGRATLAVSDHHATHRIVPDGEGIEVDVVSIDDWLRNGDVPPPTLVMIDAEGAELDVLEGMLEVMAKHRPVVTCEVHWLGEAFTDFFAQRVAPLGYALSALSGEVTAEAARWHAVLRPAGSPR
ncbi:MAG TPA: FkbM family methyltransferase [Solirubrobacteraceae bacterium]|nr:FkbM family methyltransferase [Solirubrobacteraceae bacterium]